ILTNGIIYRFYTDLDEQNKMDEKPFLEINMLNIKGSQVSELAKFQKSNFNVEAIVDTASELKYTNEIQALFAQELQEPSDELLRFFLNSVYSGVKTQSVMERFRPILKKALNDYINELMNDKIKNALNVDAPHPEATTAAEPSKEAESEEKSAPHEDKIVTTAEELGAYFIVKMILKDMIPPQDIAYKDTINYISILYQNKVTKWICRLVLNASRKILIIPDENKKETRYPLDSIYDIEQYKDQLIAVAQRYL
ncbi:MAG TPA: endonuclease, partial [Candidatus Fimivicinus intestinavium]|nr:endonuclease [Candidatus Fimivicinus intestinavium]